MSYVRLLLLAAALAAHAVSPPAGASHQAAPRRLVVLIGDYLVDPAQLRFGNPSPPVCPFIHLGAANGSTVMTLGGMVLGDPDPGGCHFGIWGQVPVGVVFEIDPVFDNDRDGISNFFEQELGLDFNHPDSDRDGVLDGAEDTDGDGLSNEDEIYRAHTDPTSKDSDQDGIPDQVDFVLEQSAAEFTVIPTLINILSGPGGTPTADEQHAKEAVKRANVVLEKANIRLVPVGVVHNPTGGGGDDGTGGGAPGDGKLDSEPDAAGNAEYRRAIEEGVEEIGGLVGYGGAGMKVTFAADADPRNGGPGASEPGQPVVIVEQRETVDLTAATIAHEIGHALGIEEHPIQTDETTPEDTPGNFMNPSNNLEGSRQGRDDFVKENGLEKVEVTPDQVAEIQSTGSLEVWGLQGQSQSPAVKKPVARGFAIDPLGDQGAAPRHLDLRSAMLAAGPDDDSVRLRIVLGAPLPATPFVATYRLLIDADNNDATGDTLVGFGGVDRQLFLLAQRDASAGFILGSLFANTVSQTLSGVVPHPTTETVTLTLENADPQVVGSALVFTLRKDLLDLSAANVQFGVLSVDGGNVLRDSMSVLYRRSIDTGTPTLTLFQEFVDPGTTVPFTIAGFEANTEFTLEVDGDSVLTGVTGAGGAFAGSFVFPDAGPGSHFVIATPEEGAIAYSLLRVAAPLATAHDDGMLEKGYGFAASVMSAEFVMRVDPPSGRHLLREVSVCWLRAPGSSNASIDFDLNVYQVAQDGKPGALLGSLPDLAAVGVPFFPSKRFYSYDLTDLGIQTSGPIFIGPSWSPADEQGIFLCVDETAPLQPGYVSSTGTSPVDAIETVSAAFAGYRALGIRALFERLAGPCVADASTACLLGGRYEVRAHQNDFSNPNGSGKVFESTVQQYPEITSETALSASFYSFQDGNVEFFVKMNNACAGFPAGHPLRADWLWVTGATTAESVIEVTDTFTGQVRTITNPKNRPFELFLDTRAFTECDAAPAAGACTSDASTACLLDRYRVRGRQYDFSNPAGQGALRTSIVQRYPAVSSATDQSVSFYTFDDGNVEFFVKMNNACAGFPPGHPLRADWLWVTGATTAESLVTVTDTRTLRRKTIVSSKNDTFALFLDTRAFVECDAPPVP